MKTINGYEYIGQYADIYYLLNIIHKNGNIFAKVYDKTKNKIKILKIRKNETIKINNESLTVYLLNG